MTKKLLAKHLPDLTGVCRGHHVLLVCLNCGDEWSANKSDYIFHKEEQEMRCSTCGDNLELSIKRTTYDPIEPTMGVHYGHGRTTVQDLPNSSHCPCLGGPEQAACATSGCTYCNSAPSKRKKGT